MPCSHFWAILYSHCCRGEVYRSCMSKACSYFAEAIAYRRPTPSTNVTAQRTRPVRRITSKRLLNSSDVVVRPTYRTNVIGTQPAVVIVRQACQSTRSPASCHPHNKCIFIWRCTFFRQTDIMLDFYRVGGWNFAQTSTRVGSYCSQQPFNGGEWVVS